MSSRSRRWMAPLGLVGAAVALRPGTAVNKAVRQGLRAAGRTMRHVAGQLKGTAYRLSGGHPDPRVPDDVLADRIRSSLGPIEKRLDLPRIHVMVEKHVALLHGDVATTADADELIAAVDRVPGVARVESHLHVGLLPGDTRPSEGKSVEPSAARS